MNPQHGILKPKSISTLLNTGKLYNIMQTLVESFQKPDDILLIYEQIDYLFIKF